MKKVKHYYSMGGVRYYTNRQDTDSFQAMLTIANDCVEVKLFNRPQTYTVYHTKVFWHNADNWRESIDKAHRYAYLWVLLNSNS